MGRRISKKNSKIGHFKPEFLENWLTEILAFFLTFRGDSRASCDVFVGTPEVPQNVVGDAENKTLAPHTPKMGGPAPKS
jgi:hypothetical protein